jgi:hypothetical protein
MALTNKLSAIGNAIREKTGKTDLLTLDQMPEEISSIETGGGDSFYNDFWDIYQENGNRVNYDKAFFTWWDNKAFKPKYNIKPTQCTAMFQNSKISGDLREILKDLGITLDTSACTSLYATYQSTLFTAVPTIDTKNAPSVNYLFYGSKNLETIEKIISNENLTYTQAFTVCNNLKNITFEGQIGTHIAFSQSHLLTVESVQSIIDALADLTGSTTQTLTLHANVKIKLTETQIASITSKNWTLA